MLRALLVLLLLLVANVSSRPLTSYVEARFQTEPPGADIYMEGKSGPIGRSGTELTRLLREDFYAPDQTLVARTLEFRLPGHRPVKQSFEWGHFLSQGPDPAVIEISTPLQPVTFVAWMQDHWKSLLGLASSALTLMLIVALGLRSQKRQVRLQLEQARVEQELAARQRSQVEAQQAALTDSRTGAYGAGDIVSGYLLKEKLGGGGQGLVFRGERVDEATEPAVVAVKVSQLENLSDSQRKRAFREFSIANKIHSPYIVKHLGWGITERGSYFILEYVEGGKTLRDLLSPQKCPPAQFIELLRQVAEVLLVAHKAGVFHRDLKPENILIAPGPVPKVTDFGLAKDEALSVITHQDQLLGTPAYVAPEQCKGTACAASDQYAFGCIAYEYFAGHFPHSKENASPIGIIAARISGEAPAPIPAIDPQLQNCLFTMLANEPDQRYPDIVSAAKALAEAAGDSAP